MKKKGKSLRIISTSTKNEDNKMFKQLLDLHDRLYKWLFGKEVPEENAKRARNKKGQYRGDDKSTPNINEAWVGGKTPKKK